VQLHNVLSISYWLRNNATMYTASWLVCAFRDLMEMSVYDELSLEDAEALGQVDEGADIVGMILQLPLWYSNFLHQFIFFICTILV